MIIDSRSFKILLPKKIYQIFEMKNFTINEEFKQQENIFDSECFILSLIKNPENIKLEKNKKILNRLCKKVDVQKKIVKLYSKDLLTIIDSTIINYHMFVLLIILYLHLADKDKNVKFLNTTLKILQIKPNYPKSLYIWADNLVEELV